MSDYEREILLCVSGLSPQIITETVYAMAVQGTGGECIVPDEIHVVTTTTGRDLIRENLLAPENGHLLALRQDYALGGRAALPENNIHLITDAEGEPLDDIRNDDDNKAVADLLTQLIQQFTQDPATRLHVSIAGGRKTMGFYAGYALSLFGRTGDRLSHVLVNEPFESREFFYPRPEPQDINVGTAEKPRWANTRDARISLGYIPIVPMREGLGEPMVEGKLSFLEAVRDRDVFRQPHLSIYTEDRKVFLHAVELSLTESQFYWYYLLARRAQRGEEGISSSDSTLKEEMSEVLFSVSGKDVDEFKWFDSAGDLDPNNFATIRTKINNAIKALHFRKSVSTKYEIRSIKVDKKKTYSLDIDPENIDIQEWAS